MEILFETPTKIVGVTHGNRQSLLAQLDEYDEIELVREEHNPHDENAIAVLNAEGKKLGYLRAELAEEVSLYLERNPGSVLLGSILEITGGTDGKNYGCNIEVSVVRIPKEPAKQQAVANSIPPSQLKRKIGEYTAALYLCFAAMFAFAYFGVRFWAGWLIGCVVMGLFLIPVIKTRIALCKQLTSLKGCASATWVHVAVSLLLSGVAVLFILISMLLDSGNRQTNKLEIAPATYGNIYVCDNTDLDGGNSVINVTACSIGEDCVYIDIGAPTKQQMRHAFDNFLFVRLADKDQNEISVDRLSFSSISETGGECTIMVFLQDKQDLPAVHYVQIGPYKCRDGYATFTIS